MNNIRRKIPHLNSAMAGSRMICKNKKYINYKSMNGLFLIVYTMALMFLTHSSALEAESKKIRCLDSMTCTKCTIKPMCVWSLKQQSCENTNQYKSSSLIVSRIGECPKFSVVKKYDYDDNLNIYVNYDVEITNDLFGFINYLNNANMYYSILNSFQQKVKITDKTKILCPFLNTKSSVTMKPNIIFMFIKFNDIMIQFDNVADHYVTVYGHKECATDEKFKNCATCGWNTNGYSNYLKWCSSENTCNDDKSLYLKNNATNKLYEKVAYVTNDCAEINVTAVNPLSGPKTGGTAVTIIVRNHRIFVENRTLKVTVAGTVCTNPKTSGLDTITCMTSHADGVLSGPVLVEYSSFENGLKIESSQIFQFCVNPVLDANQKLGGITSGGTSVPIRGRHFVEPCVVSSVQLYVELPDGVKWYAYNYCDPPVNDTYMVCRSPRMNSAHWDGNHSMVGRLLNFGLDVMKFTGNQSLHINGTSLSFYVYPDPVLEDFVIDEAGSVVINGLSLDHVQLDDIVVRFLNSSAKCCIVVSVKSNRFVCDPTMAIASEELHEILVKIGDSLTYTLENRSPTPIVDPFNIPVSKHPSIFPDSNKTSCSDLMTCTKCTIKPMCIWSLQQQTCQNRTLFNSSGLIVFRIEECPQFSVVKEYNYGESSVSLKYIVKLSNDSVGFRNYLKDSTLYNRFPTYCKYPTKQDNADNKTIVECEFYIKKSYFDYNNPSFTFFTFIIFKDIMLRFDNVADHYVTFYEKKECANDEKYKSCATCAWNKDGYSNYLRWCSSHNTCQVRKNLYMMNNGKEQLNVKLAHLTNDCAEINVTAVDPLFGPESGGTTVTITVRNHKILADNRTVIVMMAGTLCMNPRTSGLESLTCNTSQSVGALSGPIIVEYSSAESVLKIVSSQIFQFCPNPVLDVNQQLGGVVSGGTSVLVRGDHFVEPCGISSARLYVDLADGVREYADSYCDPPVNNTYMVCVSPILNRAPSYRNQSEVGRLLDYGVEMTKFYEKQSLHVNGTSLSFYVHPDPIFENFAIDEDNPVVISGLNLDNVLPDDIVVQFLNSSDTGCKVVSVQSKHIVCIPTMTFDPIAVQEILVKIGKSLSYNVANRSPTPIVDPLNFPVAEHPSILADSNKTSCSDLMTCTKCMIKPMCIWSIQQQACKNNTNFISSDLIVFTIEDCPRISVIKEHHYCESSVTLKYIVKLSNDFVGFRNYLIDIIFYNRFPSYCKHPTQKVNKFNETIISCEFYVKKSYFDYNNPSFTFFTFINFNDVMLRFDNVADHYATFYEKNECANAEKYNSCATCAWNSDGYSNYLRWCSSDNTCLVRNDIYMMNNGKEQFNVKLAHLTNNCAEINVTSVDPLTGPESGGTTVTITVRNHKILADNRTVIVMMAGTLCMNPRTSGLETLTCNTSQSVGALSGPILVEYSSAESVLKIVSSQIFQFCPNPVLDADQQLGGVVSGGTSVPVRGNHFVETCFAFLARLYVDYADGVRRYADSYCDPPVNDTYMVCRSPRVNGDCWDGDASVVGRLLNFGLDITLSKDDLSSFQSQSIAVRGPSLSFYVHADPVLLDFKIDKSGSVVVNGLHLQDLQPNDIVIRAVDSPSSVCIFVSVIQDSLVCEPNMSISEAQVISVALGNSLEFTVIKKTLPHPSEIPGWFITVIVMSTVLLFVLFVSSLACCLRNKNRVYVTENIINLPESSRSSQDLYEQTGL